MAKKKTAKKRTAKKKTAKKDVMGRAGRGRKRPIKVDVFLAFEGVTGRMRMIPIARTLIDSRTGKPMPPMTWHFTGSVMRKPDPNKDAKVYAADLSGTLISIYPVTDETVLQSSMTLAEESLLKLDTNRNVLPAEGAEVKLIIKAR